MQNEQTTDANSVFTRKTANVSFEEYDFSWKSFFTHVGVAAHLRGMRPTRSSQKDTLMLRGKLKFETIN